MNNANKILELNKSFYIQAADHFDLTRQYSWRGWEKLFKYFDKSAFYPESFLDLGCGNGRFVESIKSNIKGRFEYHGIDNNKYLIRQANTKYKSDHITFKQEDIFEAPKVYKKFDLITIFGVFHHIPSEAMRIDLLEGLKKILNLNGKIVFTTWNFKGRKLFNKRLKPYEIELLGINPKQIKTQDFFLKWADNPKAIRFCHYYTKLEIKSLLKDTGYDLEYTFNADGGDKKTNSYYVISPA